eukprot:3939727-Rhodomonas_salina.2
MAASWTSDDAMKLSELDGEWSIVASERMPALAKGATLLVDSTKGLAQTKVGAQTTTYQLDAEAGDQATFRLIQGLMAVKVKEGGAAVVGGEGRVAVLKVSCRCCSERCAKIGTRDAC